MDNPGNTPYVNFGDVLRYYRGDDFDSTAVTLIDRSVESHYMAFAAEESRLSGGCVISMDDFVAGLQ